MTVAQLERAVANLGFAPSIEDGGELLLEAAGRALGEISAVRPRLATGTLWHLPVTPRIHTGSREPLRGKRTYTLGGGCSYFLRLAGKGSVFIRSERKQFVHHFETEPGKSPAVIFGEVPEDDSLCECTVSGRGGVRVLTLAVYDEPVAQRDADPDRPLEYDLASLLDGFAELAAPPLLANGKALREGNDGEYTCSNGRLLRLYLKGPAEVRITYRRTLSIDKSGELPLSDEEAALVPLFCAAYVYLDEEPERSSFYLARFREGLAALVPHEERVAVFRDVTGWG